MKKVILGLLLAAIVGGIFFVLPYYQAIYSSTTAFDEDEKIIYIPSDFSREDLSNLLKKENIITDISWFEKVADLKKFSLVKSGRYVIAKGSSNQDIINKIRIGDQDPVKMTFNSARTIEEIAGKISYNIELDSLDVLNHISDPALAQKYGFNKESIRTMFIPNTYEVFWDITPSELINRLAKEYKIFWNDDRKSKAKKLGLSQSEVTTLASIVAAETAKKDEAPMVAGLYLNRIKRKMALESDPTLIYALGDFSIKRVLNKDKEVVSPYNTYKHQGLPPGPINIPSPVFIDAVLNPASHDYIFMCAKADFSGYHNFSKSNRQHNIYAAEYRKALKASGIYR